MSAEEEVLWFRKFFAVSGSKKIFSLAEIDIQYVILSYIPNRCCLEEKYSKMVQRVDLKYWGEGKAVVLKLDFIS